jgi:hypothetical protein
MVLADWTFSGTGTGTLDTVVKYSGASSYKGLPSYANQNELVHDTFSETHACIIAWVQTDYRSNAYINHSSYGTLECSPTSYDTWQRWRITFWYDSTNNTKWGRRERWDVSDWVQVEGDTDFGSGAPAAGSIKLMNSTPNGYTKPSWFDEVEVSS